MSSCMPSITQIFQCGICNVVIKTEENIRVHMLQAHQITLNDCVNVQMLNLESEPTLTKPSGSNLVSSSGFQQLMKD